MLTCVLQHDRKPTIHARLLRLHDVNLELIELFCKLISEEARPFFR